MTKNYFRFLTIFGLMVMSYALKAETIIKVSHERNSDKSVTINFEKFKPGTYRLKVVFTELTNCRSKGFEGLVKYSFGTLMTLEPIDPSKSIDLKYTTSYSYGNDEAKVDFKFEYILPFKFGEKFTIYDSEKESEREVYGKKSLDTNKSYYIVSDKPLKVLAMRKGIVINIKNQYETDVTIKGRGYSTKRNSITIEHEDGTCANYKGFKMDSFLVKEGETVFPSTALGVTDVFKDDKYILHFSIFYLKKVDELEGLNLSLGGFTTNEFIDAIFYTKTGIDKLTPDSLYEGDYDEKVVTKEMDRKQKKEFYKD